MQCACETPRTKTNFPEGYEHSSILQMQKKKNFFFKSHCRIKIMKCPGLSSLLEEPQKGCRCVSLLFRDSESGLRQLVFYM